MTREEYNNERKGWEDAMFDGLTSGMTDAQRPKYFAVNKFDDPAGDNMARHIYGNSFFVLKKNLRYNCTAASGDSRNKQMWRYLGCFHDLSSVLLGQIDLLSCGPKQYLDWINQARKGRFSADEKQEEVMYIEAQCFQEELQFNSDFEALVIGAEDFAQAQQDRNFYEALCNFIAKMKTSSIP